jgi:hypothetical protein
MVIELEHGLLSIMFLYRKYVCVTAQTCILCRYSDMSQRYTRPDNLWMYQIVPHKTVRVLASRKVL